MIKKPVTEVQWYQRHEQKCKKASQVLELTIVCRYPINIASSWGFCLFIHLSHQSSSSDMGNKISRPARKLNKTILEAGNVSRTAQARLPPQALKEQFEAGIEPRQEQRQDERQEQRQDKRQEAQTQDGKSMARPLPPYMKQNTKADRNSPHPEGRDGMDPQADQSFIDSINKLGRQIQSSTGENPGQLDVRALRQLMNRKSLYEKGQSEVATQMAGESSKARTMLHPRTLTAVLNALEGKASPSEIAQDFLVSPQYLENLGRFKVAENIVVIEEQTKEDEIGPKAARPSELMIDYDGDMSEEVNSERLRQLRLRLE